MSSYRAKNRVWNMRLAKRLDKSIARLEGENKAALELRKYAKETTSVGFDNHEEGFIGGEFVRDRD